MQKINTNGAEISFTTFTPSDHELNRWVTLVNGFMRPQSDFKQMARAFTKAGFHVITLDNRGVGDTKIDSSFTVQDMSNDVLKIWDALDIGASALVGVSMGGIISQVLAAQAPSKVCHLALVSTLQNKTYFKNAAEELPDNLEAMIEYLRLYVAPQFYARNKLLIDAMAKQMLAKNQQALADSPEFSGSHEQRRALRDWEPLTDDDVRQWPQGLKVGVFHGREDGIISCDSALEMNKVFADSDLHLYGNTGHLLIAEKSKIFYRDLVSFLTS